MLRASCPRTCPWSLCSRVPPSCVLGAPCILNCMEGGTAPLGRACRAGGLTCLLGGLRQGAMSEALLPWECWVVGEVPLAVADRTLLLPLLVALGRQREGDGGLLRPCLRGAEEEEGSQGSPRGQWDKKGLGTGAVSFRPFWQQEGSEWQVGPLAGAGLLVVDVGSG